MTPIVLVLFAAVLAPAAARADGWSVVRSPRFEVLTDAGEMAARAAATRLEGLESALDRILPTEADAAAPRVRAIVLRRPEAIAALVPAERQDPAAVAGFFVGGSDGPVIVAPAASDTPGREAWSVLDHECVHLHLNRALAAQPVWVAEGLADALSAAELDGPEARLGEARPGRLARLQHGAPIPVTELLTLGYDSRLYRGGDARTDLVYVESEALVRWVLARHGLPALESLLAAVAAGEPPLAAFSTRFGDPAAIEAALVETPPGPLFRVAVDPASPPLAATTPSAAQVDFRLGDVLLHGDHRREAAGYFERALHAEPNHAAARAGLAQLALQKGDWADADRELRLALAASPDDAGALLRYARLLLGEARERGEGGSPQVEVKAIAALERAVALEPDLAEAVELLALEKPEPLAGRIALLQRAFDSDPGRPQLGMVLSALLARRHDIAAARDVLVRARDAARDPAYRFVCDYRLRQFQGYAAGTAEVRGRLVDVECRRDGSLRFGIAVGAGRLPLAAASRQSVFVRGTDGSEELQLACGAQDLPVRVRFVPSSEMGAEGTLLTMDALAP